MNRPLASLKRVTHIFCAFLATVCAFLGDRVLKIKTTVPKLGFHYYARVYERIGGWGVASREAPMPLKFRPKLDKIVELMLYLAHKRPGADKYQAVKFFYLADREHFNRYGRPITFEKYYAMEYGPVASTVLDILNGKLEVLKPAGLDKLPFKTEFGKTPDGKYSTTYIRAPLRQIDQDLFSKSDLEVFDEVIAKHGNDTFDQLFDLTHEHYAWLNAWETRRYGDHAEMFYDEMIDDEAKRKEVVADLGPVAANMR
jgi:uncharacterized phage-associated protein